MGQSGFDILENDEALDIHYLYFEKYNAGKTPAEIEEWFKSNYSYNFDIRIIEDNSNFWLGLALAQWETKSLSPVVKDMVTGVIEKEVEAGIWGSDYPERKKYLEKFLKKISKEKKTAKKPVKQRLFKAPFIKGDVITSPINNGTKWGVMVCIANSEGLQKMGKCLFATTTIELDRPATLEDLKGARINNESGDDSYCSEIRSAGISRLSAEIGEFEKLEKLKKIGTVPVEKNFNMSIYPHSSFDNWLELKYSAPENISLEELISKPDHEYTQWVELALSLYGIGADEKREKFGEEFSKLNDYVYEMKYNREEEYENEFIPFIVNYTRDNEAENLL